MWWATIWEKYASGMCDPEFRFGWGTTYMQYLNMDAYRYDGVSGF